MQVKSHLDGTDILLSPDDLKKLTNGAAVVSGRLTVKLASKDVVSRYNASSTGIYLTMYNPNLELTFDGSTGKLKGVEII